MFPRHVPLAARVDLPAEDVGWLERLRTGPPTGGGASLIDLRDFHRYPDEQFPHQDAAGRTDVRVQLRWPHFHRWTEALIPLDGPEDRDGNRSKQHPGAELITVTPTNRERLPVELAARFLPR